MNGKMTRTVLMEKETKTAGFRPVTKVNIMQSTQESSISNTSESPATEADSVQHRSVGGRILRLLLPVAILAIGGAAAFWMLETSPQAKPRPHARNATLVAVRSVTYDTQQTLVSGMGTVAAARSVALKPQADGEIIEMSANLAPGGHFHAGETLLKIDPTDYRLTVRQLATDVAKAQADLDLEQGNQRVARKEYDLLGERVSAEEKALMLRQPQLDNLRAVLEAAQVKLEQAKVDLQRTRVKAPFNAVVVSSDVEVGSRASVSNALATLVGTDAYWVAVSVPVSQLRWIDIPRKDGELGAKVRIYDTAAWGEGLHREGRVIRLEAGLEEQGRMARLLVRVDDPLCLEPAHGELPRMLIGAYVRVEIEGRALEAAAVEREFIHNGDSVWVLGSEEKLAIRPVEIAFRGADAVLVTDGITPGERLIVSDLAAPVAGMKLRTASANVDTETVDDGGLAKRPRAKQEDPS